jgi:hypothetical protein
MVCIDEYYITFLFTEYEKEFYMNKSWSSVAAVEAIRKHLSIELWVGLRDVS